jgi:hypothetical protein
MNTQVSNPFLMHCFKETLIICSVHVVYCATVKFPEVRYGTDSLN